MNRPSRYSRLAEYRQNQTEMLQSVSTSLVAGGDDPLDDLGMLRLVEILVETARKAIVTEAKAEGFSWQQIGSTLCISAEGAERRYGKKES